MLNLRLTTRANHKAGQPQTTKHEIVAWGRHAETCAERLRHGDPVYVKDRMQNRTRTDRKGQIHHTIQVVMEKFQILPQ